MTGVQPRFNIIMGRGGPATVTSCPPSAPNDWSWQTWAVIVWLPSKRGSTIYLSSAGSHFTLVRWKQCLIIIVLISQLEYVPISPYTTLLISIPSLAIPVYDFLLTIRLEIDTLWRRKKSLVSYVLLTNRYARLLVAMCLLSIMFPVRGDPVIEPVCNQYLDVIRSTLTGYVRGT